MSFEAQIEALREGCPCWTNGARLGHEGHCCFLVDDREGKPISECWRETDDICHVPPKVKR